MTIATLMVTIAVSYVVYAWATNEGAENIPGDINKDGIVDIFDVVTLAVSFGTEPGDENWNPAADTDHNDVVDIFDAIIVSSNFPKANSEKNQETPLDVTDNPPETNALKFKAVVNEMSIVDVLVCVNISDGLTEKEAELIAGTTFILVKGEYVTHRLDTLTFDDTQIEAHYTWGYDETDMGHIFDMTADLTTLQITVSHCF